MHSQSYKWDATDDNFYQMCIKSQCIQGSILQQFEDEAKTEIWLFSEFCTTCPNKSM